MPGLHRLEGWDLELRILKRGLMGSSRGKREINGKRRVKKGKLWITGPKTLGPYFRNLASLLPPTIPGIRKPRKGWGDNQKDFEKLSTGKGCEEKWDGRKMKAGSWGNTGIRLWGETPEVPELGCVWGAGRFRCRRLGAGVQTSRRLAN